MAEATGQELFTKAHEQYATATKWSLGLVAAALIYHLAILTPYLDWRVAQGAEQAKLADIALARRDLDLLRGRLDAMRAALTAATESGLRQLVAGLQQDFHRLDETRQWLQHQPGGRLEGAAPAKPADAEPPADPRLQMQVQRPLRQPADQVARFEIADPAVVEALKREGNRDALLRAVDPFVAQAIIGPRFEALNRSWQGEALPPARATLKELEPTLAPLRQRLPSMASSIDALAADLKALAGTLETTRFAPPDTRFWWSTVVGKEDTRFALASAVERTLQSPATLSNLEAQVKAVAEKSQAVNEELGRKLEQLQAQLKTIGEKLTEISKLFGVVTLDLGMATPLAPFFLAAVIAIALAWPAQRLRDMAIAIPLVENAPAAARLWLWLRRRSHLSEQHATGAAWRAFLVQSLILGIAAIAWVALAAWQVLSAGSAIGGQPWLAGLAPIATVLAGLAMRVMALRTVAELLPKPALAGAEG